MKNMTNEFGVGAIALPIQGFTYGTHQGTGLSSTGRRTGIVPATGGFAPRLRARDLALAPDSLPGGPVI